MPSANDLRKGQVIKFNNEPYLVMETQHRTPGNLRAFVQAKLRNLKNGRSFDQRFNSTETMEVLNTDRRTLEFSYADRENFAFMDPEELRHRRAERRHDRRRQALPGGERQGRGALRRRHPGHRRSPSAVTLKVTDAPEGIRGDTASNVQKSVVCETGLVVSAPLFIKNGDVIKVSTADGSYLGRA